MNAEEVLLKGTYLEDVNPIVNGVFFITEYFTTATFLDDSIV